MTRAEQYELDPVRLLAASDVSALVEAEEFRIEIEVATFRLLQALHRLHPECGRGQAWTHWPECMSLVGAHGYESWEAWNAKVSIALDDYLEDEAKA